MSAKYDFQTRIVLVGQQNQTVVLIFSQIVLFTVGGLKTETFQIRIILLVGIVKRGSPYLVRIKLLHDAYIIFIVVAQVEVGSIEITVVQNNQYAVVALEFTQIFTSSVIVEAEYVTVKPYFTSTERRTSFLFQGYLMYRQAGKNHASCLTSLDADLTEVMLENDTTYTRIRFQCHLDDFGFSIRVGAEIGNP